MLEEITNTTALLARNLGVIGLMNVQYAIYEKKLYIIEVNPRASRTVPFVSKATGMPLAKIATRVMWQGNLKEALEFYGDYGNIEFKNGVYQPKIPKHIAVKESVFPFNKLLGADLILGPEMKSTGEVMGMSHSFGLSFAKSQMASYNTLPKKGMVFISLCDKDKKNAKEIAQKFYEIGFEICATGGTHAFLEKEGIVSKKVLKIYEGRPNVQDSITNGEIHLVINTSDNKASKDDAKIIRSEVLKNAIPYFTTLEGARVAIEALKDMKDIHTPKALQDFLRER